MSFITCEQRNYHFNSQKTFVLVRDSYNEVLIIYLKTLYVNTIINSHIFKTSLTYSNEWILNYSQESNLNVARTSCKLLADRLWYTE